MNDGLFVIQPDGAISMINKAFERLTGYPAKAVIGKPCTILDCDQCDKELIGEGAAWCSLFNDGRSEVCYRCHITRIDGTRLPVLKNASLLQDDDGTSIGAVETITDLSELNRLDRQIDRLKRQLGEVEGFHGIIGRSPAMQQVFEVILKAAVSDAPVIIFGESGVGKELVARAIHETGLRCDKPFVQLNCAALNESLLESEIFGHAKGAFTGAYRDRPGRFEVANGGDLFLDEVGDTPPSIQVKLLRVLETNTFERVGDHRSISVDVRIISATNQDLPKKIREGTFRDDFFFRINVIPIRVPPLRERPEDIPLLANHFLERFRLRTGKPICGISPQAMKQIMDNPWPGNVRELMSALEYAFVIGEGGVVTADHLPDTIGDLSVVRTPLNRKPALDLACRERDQLIHALTAADGNRTRAARILGVHRLTVWNRIKKYSLDVDEIIGKK